MFWDYYYPALFFILSSMVLFFGLRKELRKFKLIEQPNLNERIYFLFNFGLVLVFGGTFFAGSITRIIYLLSKAS